MTALEATRSPAAVERPGPLVSVIVPHYHDLSGLGRCLDALEAQTLPRDQFEIVVADNASPEGETAVAQVIDGRARMVTVAERGAGPARNAGVARTRGAVLAFTDSDCIPAPGWLCAGLAALDRHDFVGGRMTVLVGDARRPTPTEAFELVFAFDNETYVTRKGFTVSANLFCPRALFEQVGGFRNGVAEDLDWSLRAAAAGFSIGYAAEAVVGHPARRNWPELRRKWRRLNDEAFALATEQRAGRLIWLARTLALPLSAAAHTPKVLASPRLKTRSQRLAALAMLYRVRGWRFMDSVGLLARRRAA